ncbi:unnamed protein product [Ixodes pacificus]
MKKIASTVIDVQVVIWAPDKLKRMCPKINNVKQQHHECDINHKHRYVNCNSGVVYEIPFTYGKACIGQTGRCINTRLREHALTLKSTPFWTFSNACARLLLHTFAFGHKSDQTFQRQEEQGNF